MSFIIKGRNCLAPFHRYLTSTRQFARASVKLYGQGQGHGRIRQLSTAATAEGVEDLYPSRAGICEVLPRKDPVIWTHKGISAAGPLTNEELNHYNQRGFLVLHDIFTTEEMKPVQDEINLFKTNAEHNISEDEDPTLTADSNFLTEPNTKKLRGIFAPHMHLPSVNRLTRSVKLISRAKQILADDVYIHQSRVNMHQALVGNGHHWHTDFEIFHSEDGMPRMRGLTMVVMLNINTPQQGSLIVVPESHKIFIPTAKSTSLDSLETNSKFKIQYGAPDEAILSELVDQHGIEYCNGDPGSVIIFDLNLVHANQNNLSTLDRTNLFVVYNSMENKLVKPFNAPWDRRPEHMAARDKKWVQPLQPIENLLSEEN
ncbi:ectoine dioxygenase-like [Ptychodera flava]|uniref:ectoine dioxygenase-like n=1 Tax=Ptychodera flava TaxID=63121 RepID=UPI003969E573